jgi:hypothetical protein
MYAGFVPFVTGYLFWKTDVSHPTNSQSSINTPTHQRTGENARIALCQLNADPLRNLADDRVMTDTISIQGKWNMRGKLRGDPIAEW